MQQCLPWKATQAPSYPSSASSVVDTPADGASCLQTTQSSGNSGSVLKERDYIGMAEVSSAPAESVADAETAQDLNLEETNLRLGLGPLQEPQISQKMAPASLEVKKCELTDVTDIDSRRAQATRSSQETAKPEWSVADSLRQRHAPSDMQQRNAGQESRYAFVDGAPEQRSLQNVWQGREFQNLPASIPGQDFRSTLFTVPSLKNGVKRAYSEAMADAVRFNAGEMRPGANGGAGTVTTVNNIVHTQEPEGKAQLKHDQAAFWAAMKPQIPASWHTGLEQSAGPYGSVPSSKPPAGIATPRAHKVGDGSAVAWEPRNKPHEHSMSKDNPQHSILDNNQESAVNDAPLPKSQVVGWPPIRSYRKNTLAAHPKPAGDEGQIFVKVNMDGVPIGRKVDLNAYTCYEGLLLALEEMFQPQGASQGSIGRENDAKPLHLLNGSELVLTYEDKDGDWMLVGDVPWGMFVDTVRRLRIMRGSEATGLGCSSTR